jgi:glycyl-tRNA synthetase beta chain
MSADLLIELGTEELPPSALMGLRDNLPAAVAAELDELGIPRGEVQGFASPRHLAVRVADVGEYQKDQAIERKGPAVAAAFDGNGEPTKAANGFARSCGVSVAELGRLSTDKGEWLAYHATQPGAATSELLPGVLTRSLDKLPLPKRMRWGTSEAGFVRPVHWLVVLHGTSVIPCEAFGMRADRTTRGHRFHHPEPLELGEPSAYEATLRQGWVIVDFLERRATIREQVVAAGREAGGETEIHEDLLDEVTALVEWPVAIAGSFDGDFLRVPPEALVSSMEDHQKYFPVRDAEGQLMARFVAVANIASREPAQVIAGNERVIRPRLADAAFFWDQDRKTALAERVPALAEVVFQQTLGTLHDKSVRVARLAAGLARELGTEPTDAERAGWLSKADLLTEMVDEFPELQGIMGEYYAGEDGERGSVARALREVYQPRFGGDAIPMTDVGATVALAERMDTLVGLFGIGQPPTGAKDPFALRRAGLGALRIAIEGGWPVDLHRAIDTAAEALSEQGVELAEGTSGQVADFLFERLRAYYREQGVAPDSFDAVLAIRPARPLDFDQRLRALESFRGRPESAALVAADKRIRNIQRKSEHSGETHVDKALIGAGAESDLLAAVRKGEEGVTPAIEASDYARALETLAGLREPVDRFFEDVMVMAEDPEQRRNRLALLARLSRLMGRVADFAELQG